MGKVRGFTLIELLVAMSLLLFVISGFMIAMANYTLLTVRAKTFEYAKDFAESVKYTIDGMSSDHPLFNPLSFPAGKDWDASYCDVAEIACSFEVDDSDNDLIPDFYDPLSGENKLGNTNYATWLRVYPSSDGSCQCNGGNCPSIFPFRCGVKYGNTDIYLALTVANVMNVKDPSEVSAKAIGVTVWYFEHRSGKYKEIRSVMFKGVEGKL